MNRSVERGCAVRPNVGQRGFRGAGNAAAAPAKKMFAFGFSSHAVVSYEISAEHMTCSIAFAMQRNI